MQGLLYLQLLGSPGLVKDVLGKSDRLQTACEERNT